MRCEQKQSQAIRYLLCAGLGALLLLSFAPMAMAAGDSHGPTPVNWTSLSYGDKDVHGGPKEKGDAPMAPPLLFAIINFGLLVALLAWKAGGPLKRYAKSRHDKIGDALAEAEKLRSAAQATLDECSQRIKNVDSEIESLVTDIRRTAELDHQRIVEQAEAQATALMRDARARIAGEIQRASAMLQSELLEQVVAKASQLVTSNINDEDRHSLVDAFISEIEQTSQAGEPRA